MRLYNLTWEDRYGKHSSWYPNKVYLRKEKTSLCKDMKNRPQDSIRVIHFGPVDIDTTKNGLIRFLNNFSM